MSFVSIVDPLISLNLDVVNAEVKNYKVKTNKERAEYMRVYRNKPENKEYMKEYMRVYMKNKRDKEVIENIKNRRLLQV